MYKTLLFFLLIGLVFVFVYKLGVSQKNGPNAYVHNFLIKKGDTLSDVALRLKEQGIIKSVLIFKVYEKLHHSDTKIKAGEYKIKTPISIIELNKIFVQGGILKKERDVQIIEGWNISDIEKYLKAKKIKDAEKFSILAHRNVSFWKKNLNYEFLNYLADNVSLEGFLFPDTYRVFEDADSADLIKKMLANFNSKIDKKYLDEIQKQNKTLYEIITMASLIQKEVRSEDDMRIVSGIFWNRIKNKQALQSCATLAYILGENKAQYSLEDTKINSPYNTYRNLGLPPGPICNPGLQAIMAAIYPVDTDYNYFLSSFKDGKTIFSKTYQEHLQNKAKFLK